MRREWAVLQTLRDVHPAQAIFMQDEGRVAALTLKASFVSSRSIIGRFTCLEIRDVNAGPFFRIPPDKFFAFAPWLTVRLRAGAIINDAAITRPTEAPTVSEIILRLARVRLVHAVSIENAGINPGAARGRAVGFQFIIIGDLRTMMRLPFSIDTEDNPVSAAGVTAPGYRFRLPTIDLSEHCFHFWLAEFVLRVPPVECAQWFVYRIIGGSGFGDQPQSQLMNEPRVGPRIARGLDRFLAPLQETLSVCERAFFFRMSGCRKEKDFGFNLVRFQFAALDLRCKRVFGAPTAEFCPIRNIPSIFPSAMSYRYSKKEWSAVIFGSQL